VVTAAEQILTSGTGLMIGALTGNIAGRRFVPIFQLTFGGSGHRWIIVI
jgi:hypothetical protein